MQGDLSKERLRGRAGGEEAVSTAMLARLLRVGGERREVALIFELLPCITRTGVTRDLVGAIEDQVVAETAGVLCGRAGTSDVIDASVVLVARRERAVVVTSDVDDLRRLDPTLPLERI